MAYDDEDGNGLRCEILETVRKSVFQRFKLGWKIVEILQKCCYNVDFLQKIAFDHCRAY